jgi:hypothetical protein
VSEVSQARSAVLEQLDLLVIGAPTHAFSLSRPATRADAVRQGAPQDRAQLGLREWLANVQPGEHGPAVAVFDTRASKVRRLPTAAAPRAAKLASRQGFHLACRPTYFLVEDIKGPLAPGELDRAREWGRQLAASTRARPRDQGLLR